ncbi:hypothetical protein OIV83_004580 [Microbotryomycetes sp. JL201]|nr:hypothetical protein OIV83_004580 [Microbotryomycetes sp. JL201]
MDSKGDRREAVRRQLQDEDLYEQGADKSKLACSRELPDCSFCAEHDHECAYTKVVRTPLTRKNLDAAEKRIATLENLLQRFRASSGDHDSDNPDVESNSRLNLKDEPHATSLPPQTAPPRSDRSLSSPILASARSVSQSAQHPSSAAYAAIPGPARSDIISTAGASDSTTASAENGDGTGSLTVEDGAAGGGYLGSLSGAALLHFLQNAADVKIESKSTAKSAASPASTSASQTAVTADQADKFVDAYFRVFHTVYPVIHEATFRAQLAEIVPRPSGAAWKLLHLVILGIGSMCTLADVGEQEATLIYYERAAQSVSTATFESTSLTGIQAFILLANFAQKLNHTAAGAVFLGIALRMSINFGLHTEATARSLSPFEQEMRRRVWWTLFCFDCGAQMTFGHPSTMPTQGVDVLCLVNVNDATFTPSAKMRPTGSTLPTSNSSIIFQTYFHQVANSIIHTLTTSAGPNPVTATTALHLCHDLDVLESTLPAYYFHRDPKWFDFPRQMFFWRTQNLRMLVLRSTFLKVALAGSETVSVDEERAWQKCTSCATQIVRSVQKYTDEQPRSCMEWWYCLHFVFPAIFVLLIALRVRPAHPEASREWLTSVQRAANTVERVHYTLLKPLAQRCLTIITAVANVPQLDMAPFESDPVGLARHHQLQQQQQQQQQRRQDQRKRDESSVSTSDDNSTVVGGECHTIAAGPHVAVDADFAGFLTMLAAPRHIGVGAIGFWGPTDAPSYYGGPAPIHSTRVSDGHAPRQVPPTPPPAGVYGHQNLTGMPSVHQSHVMSNAAGGPAAADVGAAVPSLTGNGIGGGGGLMMGDLDALLSYFAPAMTP